jgi:UDP-glucose 4-epimerase
VRIVFDKALARVARFTRSYRFETKFDSPLGDNVTTGLNLLQSFVEHGVKRVILSSTANLFDQPERMPIDESERTVPGSPYGGSKFILERILHWLDGICGVRFACLRCFNAAGATSTRGEDHDPELRLTRLVLQFALGKRGITGRTMRADAGPQRAGDPAVLVAASNKIRKELGWASRFPHVREIVESAWQSPQANPNGY